MHATFHPHMVVIIVELDEEFRHFIMELENACFFLDIFKISLTKIREIYLKNYFTFLIVSVCIIRFVWLACRLVILLFLFQCEFVIKFRLGNEIETLNRLFYNIWSVMKCHYYLLFSSIPVKTDYFANSFFPYCVNKWNNLDPAIRNVDKISSFKKALLL